MITKICQSPGKLIISGEYAVVFGYPGIAIPAPFTTTVTFHEGNSLTPSLLRQAPAVAKALAGRQDRLWPSPSAFAKATADRQEGGNESNLIITHHGIENEDYLYRILEEIQKHTGPLSGNIAIENTIPIGRGMGSSTALVIAVTRCLFQYSPPPAGEGQGEGLKKIAAAIEDTVNPGHSGLDFEVIWNEKPILFRKGSPPKTPNVTINQLIVTPHQFCLIDTGKPTQTTSELVAWVRSRQHEPAVAAALQTIGHCTERLLKGKDIKEVFKAHHRAQVTLGIVPSHVQNFIAQIEESGGAAKIIGAGGRSGGGGIVLALAKNASTLAASYGYRCLNTEHCLHQVLG